MKSLILSFCLILPFMGFSQDILLPVSAPDKALSSYETALGHLWNADWAKFDHQMEDLLEANPAFFMAHVQIIFAARHRGNKELVATHLANALESQGERNEAEQVIFNALLEMLEDKDSDLSNYWLQLIEAFPTTIESHAFLYMENLNQNKISENTQLIDDMIAMGPSFAPLYNLKGYNALAIKDYPAAARAFDQYIELEPKLPNPYDSKGDYYMAVENYEMAAQSYMTAYERDNTWTASLDRANEANSLMDQQQAKESDQKK